MINIRVIKPGDGEKFIILNEKLSEDPGFSMMEKDEREQDPIVMEQQILAIRESSNTEVFVLEEEDNTDRFIGFIGAFGGRYKKIRHSVHIVIGVLKEFRGKGLAGILLDTIFLWAKNVGIHRLELEVTEDNQSAINLYKKKGFEIEGLKRDSLVLETGYMGEFIMAKIL